MGNLHLRRSYDYRIEEAISVTPPCLGSYWVAKYVSREDPPLPFDDGLYEVRLLTVRPSHRGAIVAVLLVYAAFRWIESDGGRQIISIGRMEVSTTPSCSECTLSATPSSRVE